MKWWKRVGAPKRRSRPPEVVEVEEERSRSRARVRWTVRGTSHSCTICSDYDVRFESLALLRGEQRGPDDVVVFFCRKHRHEALKRLAVGHMYALSGDDPWPALLRSELGRRRSVKKKEQRAPGRARDVLTFDAAVKIAKDAGIYESCHQRAQRHPRLPIGIPVGSPLYCQMFTQLVDVALKERQQRVELRPLQPTV